MEKDRGLHLVLVQKLEVRDVKPMHQRVSDVKPEDRQRKRERQETGDRTRSERSRTSGSDDEFSELIRRMRARRAKRSKANQEERQEEIPKRPEARQEEVPKQPAQDPNQDRGTTSSRRVPSGKPAGNSGKGGFAFGSMPDEEGPSPFFMEEADKVWQQEYLARALLQMKETEIMKLKFVDGSYRPYEYERWINAVTRTMTALHPEMGNYWKRVVRSAEKYTTST